MVKKIILIAIVGSLTGCTKYVSTPHPCPPRPILQPIPAAEFNNISDETYAKLVRREEAIKAYARVLEVNCGR